MELTNANTIHTYLVLQIDAYLGCVIVSMHPKIDLCLSSFRSWGYLMYSVQRTMVMKIEVKAEHFAKEGGRGERSILWYMVSKRSKQIKINKKDQGSVTPTPQHRRPVQSQEATVCALDITKR